jgi:hypothetical protein
LISAHTRSSISDERPTILIRDKNNYHANVSDSPLGTISSIEHALDGLEDRLQTREQDLKQYHRQSEDLAKQLNQPFEHQEKLATATKRQQEIVTALVSAPDSGIFESL